MSRDILNWCDVQSEIYRAIAECTLKGPLVWRVEAEIELKDCGDYVWPTITAKISVTPVSDLYEQAEPVIHMDTVRDEFLANKPSAGGFRIIETLLVDHSAVKLNAAFRLSDQLKHRIGRTIGRILSMEYTRCRFAHEEEKL